jgi:hypothetical protein
MGFITLNPPLLHHGAKGPRVSASVVSMTTGESRCFVNLSKDISAQVKSLRAVVRAGDGEHRGMIRIEFLDSGEFALRGYNNKAKNARLYLPDMDCLPRQTCPAAVARIVTFADNVLVIRLPLEAWNAEIARRSGKARAA